MQNAACQRQAASFRLASHVFSAILTLHVRIERFGKRILMLARRANGPVHEIKIDQDLIPTFRTIGSSLVNIPINRC